ncbi:MAG: fumarylacetoacetate hydrolase family protein [Alphaproteobacteria bacterium]|nr:fumarylacetoacetate hydrolase family protein [Alphaproteobacteria bacterium]
MKLVTFESGNGQRLGALIGAGSVLDLELAAARSGKPLPAFSSMLALIEGGASAWDDARALIAKPEARAIKPLSEVRLLAPLPRPTRLRDCSLFLEHMEKALTRMARTLAQSEPDPDAAYTALMASGKYSLKPIFKQQVVYYNADHMSVSGTGADITWPSYSEWIDYELEWACVIGSPGRDIKRESAKSHIFGYTIFNDWSARDVQFPLMETMLGPGEGKDFPGGYGLGPCIVTPDEIGDPYNLTMTARINGEEWSRGSTSSMYHKFEDAITQFSREKTLHSGEVIGSGTVLSGCGFELGRRLAIGDVVELEIENIGVMRNRIVRTQS